MTSSSNCPEDRTLRGFLAGALAEPTSVELERHLSQCPRCRQRLEELKTLSESGRTASPSSDTVAHEADEPDEDDDWQSAVSALLEPSLVPGSLGRLGHYEVTDFLGSGAMGLVVKAYEAELSRTVAIKLLNPRLTASPKAHRRFLREARSAAAINHPNVVTIHAIDVEAGVPYLVMEYIAGGSLRQRIHAQPKLEPLQLARIAGQIAAGLAAAHQVGVIHRDIKLANIMLENSLERVKITDFGLARAALDYSVLTSVGHTVGTPAYMSPEQVKGERVDFRSDLFSLGCVVYAMATGNSPFAGSTNIEIINKVCNHYPPPLYKVCPGFPLYLSQVVERLLEKRPRDRFSSAAEAATAFSHYCAAVSQKTSVRLPVIRVRRGRFAAAALLSATVAGFGLVGWELYQTFDRSNAAPVAAHPAPANPSAPTDAGANATAPAAKVTVTVSQSSKADFATVVGALRSVGPGSTIRILDDAVYEGNLLLETPGQWRDVTIESPAGATLVGAKEAPKVPVIRINDNPGVVLRGLRIEAQKGQFGLYLSGDGTGALFEDLQVLKEPQSEEAAVALVGGAHGTAQAPIVLRRVLVEGYAMGIFVHGDDTQPACWIHFEDCRIKGPDNVRCIALLLDTAVCDVRVLGNVFYSAFIGLNINLQHAELAENIEVAHNTFADVGRWIGFGEHPAHLGRFSIHHNLVVESPGLSPGPTDLRLTAAKWFSDNVWELPANGDVELAKLVAQLRPTIPLISRKPGHPDFLRPTSQAGLERPDPHLSRPYIGALMPSASKGEAPADNPKRERDHE